MMKLVQDNRQDILDQFIQYNVHQAWFDVICRGNRFGIFGLGIFSTACPIEPLHSVENGIIPICLTIFFKDEIVSSQKAELDSHVRRLTLFPHQCFLALALNPVCPAYLGKMVTRP
jgi:hypothetical protein